MPAMYLYKEGNLLKQGTFGLYILCGNSVGVRVHLRVSFLLLFVGEGEAIVIWKEHVPRTLIHLEAQWGSIVRHQGKVVSSISSYSNTNSIPFP